MSDAYELEKVTDWRVRGRGWQTIAENLRRPVEDVRRRYDPKYQGFRRPAAPAPPPLTCIRARTSEAKLKADLDVLALFYFDPGWVSVKGLTTRQRAALSRLKLTHGTTVLQSQRTLGTRLTDSGRTLYERLVQE